MIGVRRCSTVDGRLALCQVSDAGRGKPQYSKNHLLRQRLSVVRMLCPMCGEATPVDDRWTQVAKRTPAGVLRRRAVDVPADIDDDTVVIDAGAIAPLHRRCVDRSLQHCPHLKASPDIHLMRFPTAWTVIPLYVETDPVGGMRPQVVGFLQLCGLTRTIDRRWWER